MVENYEDPIRKAPPAKILILTPNPDEIISHARSSLPEDLTIFRGSPGIRSIFHFSDIFSLFIVNRSLLC